MKIYNSLTRKKEEFISLRKGHVGMYVCGPTVYDEPHIGHARSAYIFDVIRRYLEYKKYKVTFVRNVTDVDDKIIAKAKEECPSLDINEAVKKVSVKYLKSYHQALDAFGIMKPDEEPKATEYIDKMKGFIGVLVEKGAAYESGGDVYFDIRKSYNYGKLSNQNLEAMEAGARISPGENKRDPMDFALWKAAKEGEPSWPSPWGHGRPGWHIECSVMSSDILGNEFDIHGGGIDLIFPHHENEIAQSEGADNKFARYWIHNGLLTINGQKMAKSLGNFITIKDFMERYKDTGYLKLFFLSAHYSHPIDFTAGKIEEARKSYERMVILRDKLLRKVTKSVRKPPRRGQSQCESLPEGDKVTSKKNSEIEDIKKQFVDAMDDDFNMPKGLAVIFELVNYANKNMDNFNCMYNVNKVLKELLDIFGITLRIRTKSVIKTVSKEAKKLIELLGDEKGSSEVNIDEISDKKINSLILKRDKARHDRDFVTADRIRKELEEQGIILEDTKDGTTWRKKIM